MLCHQKYCRSHKTISFVLYLTSELTIPNNSLSTAPVLRGQGGGGWGGGKGGIILFLVLPLPVGKY